MDAVRISVGPFASNSEDLIVGREGADNRQFCFGETDGIKRSPRPPLSSPVSDSVNAFATGALATATKPQGNIR
jgi:hypothetical protein